MMIVTFALNDWKIEPLSVNPLIGPSADVLIEAGARETSLIVNEGQWFRLISPLVLHAGVIHFVINMLALWFIGAAVEQSHGFASAAILFFIPAVGGNILSAIFLPQYISVGASGGIFGLIGGCLADVALNWNLLFIKGEHDEDNTRWRHSVAFFWLFFDIFINCLIGLTPFVDNFTHLGGLLYGVCCGISTIERLAVGFFGVATGRCSRIRNSLFRFCGLIFSVCLIMITTVLLVGSDGSTSPCPSCRFISCVPFPIGTENKWWNCDDCDFAVADLIKLHATSVNYDRIDLTCPNGEISFIDIAEEQLADREVIRRKLPKYCRANCDDVFHR
jgi:membrane associated rhomboid family serine protease